MAYPSSVLLPACVWPWKSRRSPGPSSWLFTFYHGYYSYKLLFVHMRDYLFLPEQFCHETHDTPIEPVAFLGLPPLRCGSDPFWTWPTIFLMDSKRYKIITFLSYFQNSPNKLSRLIWPVDRGHNYVRLFSIKEFLQLFWHLLCNAPERFVKAFSFFEFFFAMFLK